MRKLQFKMERPGLVSEGEEVVITEGLLPSNYYYVINPAVAMSGNIPFTKRLMARKGIVRAIEENSRGFYVTVEFDEEDPDAQ